LKYCSAMQNLTLGQDTNYDVPNEYKKAKLLELYNRKFKN